MRFSAVELLTCALIMNSHMRKFFVSLLLFLVLGSLEVSAQLNKNYFFWVGRSYIIDNKFRDAIETLNVLLKVDTTA